MKAEISNSDQKIIMQLNLLEAHDRYLHIQKQAFSISNECQKIIDARPFGNHPFYIFAHARTMEDGATKRLIWQPRLTKPRAQSNSMLFKAYPGTDNVKIIWMIPDRIMWNQYKKGNVTHLPFVEESIHNFLHNKESLEAPEKDDLTDEQIDAIYREIATAKKM